MRTSHEIADARTDRVSCHDDEDEFFLKGSLEIEMEDRTVERRTLEEQLRPV
jgi:hypothetical protein